MKLFLLEYMNKIFEFVSLCLCSWEKKSAILAIWGYQTNQSTKWSLKVEAEGENKTDFSGKTLKAERTSRHLVLYLKSL